MFNNLNPMFLVRRPPPPHEFEPRTDVNQIKEMYDYCDNLIDPYRQVGDLIGNATPAYDNIRIMYVTDLIDKVYCQIAYQIAYARRFMPVYNPHMRREDATDDYIQRMRYLSEGYRFQYLVMREYGSVYAIDDDSDSKAAKEVRWTNAVNQLQGLYVNRFLLRLRHSRIEANDEVRMHFYKIMEDFLVNDTESFALFFQHSNHGFIEFYSHVKSELHKADYQRRRDAKWGFRR